MRRSAGCTSEVPAAPTVNYFLRCCACNAGRPSAPARQPHTKPVGSNAGGESITGYKDMTTQQSMSKEDRSVVTDALRAAAESYQDQAANLVP
jgi:hypothetical protein